MSRARRTYDLVVGSVGVVPFRDLQHLLGRLAFELDRVSGSHHIYVHPNVPRPLNVQPIGKDAKPYQVRQLRDMIVEFGLEVD
ncbi:MAG: type II toxin-antitoxin system HicA family toxin [Microvirga sp.]